MSWSVSGTGTPDHLKELVRRHAHHHWGYMRPTDIGAVRHMIAHVLNALEPDTLHTFQASGSTEPGHVNFHLVADKPTPTDLLPPVPEDTTVPGDAPPEAAPAGGNA